MSTKDGRAMPVSTRSDFRRTVGDPSNLATSIQAVKWRDAPVPVARSVWSLAPPVAATASQSSRFFAARSGFTALGSHLSEARRS